MEIQQEMTYDEAIEKLINICNEYKDIVNYLKEENDFLINIIEDNNMGELLRKKRILKKEME